LEKESMDGRDVAKLLGFKEKPNPDDDQPDGAEETNGDAPTQPPQSAAAGEPDDSPAEPEAETEDNASEAPRQDA